MRSLEILLRKIETRRFWFLRTLKLRLSHLNRRHTLDFCLSMAIWPKSNVKMSCASTEILAPRTLWSQLTSQREVWTSMTSTSSFNFQSDTSTPSCTGPVELDVRAKQELTWFYAASKNFLSWSNARSHLRSLLTIWIRLGAAMKSTKKRWRRKFKIWWKLRINQSIKLTTMSSVSSIFTKNKMIR